MQSLPNNCRIGKISVYPSNWKTKHANYAITWRITYWFYDDDLKKKKQVLMKGMNHLTTLKEKQVLTASIIDFEMEDLQNGYNPITLKHPEDSGEISENTGLAEALNYALEKVTMVTNTRSDLTNCLKYLFESIRFLRLEVTPIKNIQPRQIKAILDGCSRIKTWTDSRGVVHPKKWGPYQFNRNRAYLSLLFGYLVENFIIPVNPVHPIKKAVQAKNIRETTTVKQRKVIGVAMKENLYPFYRFIQIFFHSGSRITELLKVKKEDIRLDEQRFKVTVLKGKKLNEEWRTIKTIALPYWSELHGLAQLGEYIFHKGLVPGKSDKPIRSEQITRRWRRHVKKKLGITADIYSLKHSNLDEIAASFGIQKAQEAAGHSTPVITMTYLHGEPERQHERLKDAGNEF